MSDAPVVAATANHPGGPPMVRTSPPPLTLGDLGRLGRIVSDLPPKSLEAWLACGRRIVGGMPVADAEALMWLELGGRPQ